MALYSMTGYGCGRTVGSGMRIEVELWSVNRKQLNIRVNLPRMLAATEPDIHAAIQKRIARGQVTGEIKLSPCGAARQSAVRVDEELAKAYLLKLRSTAAKLGLSDNLSADLLLKLPQVVLYEPPDIAGDECVAAVHRALDKALRQLVGMRRREGRALQEDITARLDVLAEKTADICRRAPLATVKYRDTLLERLRRAGLSGNDTDDRLFREIAQYAERCDIAEELTRLNSHLKQARKLLRTAPPVGRTFDFLAQEMFREINTVASKVNDGNISGKAVDFKAELERLREQVQNIE